MSLTLIVIALLVLLVMSWTILLAFQLLGLLLHLLVAGVVGAVADAVVPGKLPWGWLGAVVAGLVGSWLGTQLIGHVGPSVAGVPIVPSFAGAVILAFVVSFLQRRQASRL